MNRFFPLLLLVLFTGCSFIEPGYVGIKVNSYGNQKGVEDFPIQTGRVHFNPFTESIYTFPTFMQNRAWTISDGEGFTFNSKEGAKITASVGLNYSIDPDKVPHLFVAHRQELDDVTDGYVRTQVRDAFVQEAGKLSNIAIMGEGQQALLESVKQRLNDKLDSRGFNIDGVSFIGAPEADQRVMNSINAVIEATQRAQEAQAKVATVKAEAEQARALADGAADAIKTRAAAEAEANLIVAKSITPTLLQYEAVKKWDGVAPKVVGGGSAGLLLGIDTNDNK